MTYDIISYACKHRADPAMRHLQLLSCNQLARLYNIARRPTEGRCKMINQGSGNLYYLTMLRRTSLYIVFAFIKFIKCISEQPQHMQVYTHPQAIQQSPTMFLWF